MGAGIFTVDTHCHLTDFTPIVGVSDVVVPAYDRGSWDRIDGCVGASGFHPAYGYHPWVAHQPVDLVVLAQRLSLGRAVAVGEIGLDTKCETSGLAEQLPLLEAQLQLAVDRDLPVILHCRGAIPELLAALANHRGQVRGVLHGFSRGLDVAEKFVRAGLHLGLGGVLTRHQAHRVRAAARGLPRECVVLETDAPDGFIAGVPRGQVTPSHLSRVLVALAELRAEPVELVACYTSANARGLFDFSKKTTARE